MANQTLYVVKSRWHLYLIICILAAVVVWLAWFQPPKVITVHEGDDPGADHVIHFNSDGDLIGHTPIRPKLPSKPGAISPKGESNAEPVKVEPARQELILRQVYNVPQVGKIHTKYFDKRTGLLIGEGDHPFTGSTAVWIEDGELWAKTTFTNNFDLSIDLPKEKWSAGLFGGASFDGLIAGAFYRRDLRFGAARFELAREWPGGEWEGRAVLEWTFAKGNYKK